MQLTKRIFTGSITFILVVILIVSLYITISSKVTGGQPSVFGNELMLVLSGSMEPAIQTGSVVGVKEIVDKTALEKGDIVTFYSPIKENTIVTHRIIDVVGSGQFVEYITKGDNNETADPLPVPSELMIGKYSGLHVPYAGYILEFVQSKNGIAFGLIIPGLLLILYNVISLWRIFGKMESAKPDQPA
ncbi:signal peptidase I [bacterium LRH843]|nr:signal peptidase I [bacterium LRH843]